MFIYICHFVSSMASVPRASNDLEDTRIAKRHRQFAGGTLQAARQKETEASQSTHAKHVCSYCQAPFENNPENPDMLPYDTACGIEIHRICILLHQFYCKICQQHKSTIQDANSSTLESRIDATKL